MDRQTSDKNLIGSYNSLVTEDKQPFILHKNVYMIIGLFSHLCTKKCTKNCADFYSSMIKGIDINIQFRLAPLDTFRTQYLLGFFIL